VRTSARAYRSKRSARSRCRRWSSSSRSHRPRCEPHRISLLATVTSAEPPASTAQVVSAGRHSTRQILPITYHSGHAYLRPVVLPADCGSCTAAAPVDQAPWLTCCFALSLCRAPGLLASGGCASVVIKRHTMRLALCMKQLSGWLPDSFHAPLSVPWPTLALLCSSKAPFTPAAGPTKAPPLPSTCPAPSQSATACLCPACSKAPRKPPPLHAFARCDHLPERQPLAQQAALFHPLPVPVDCT
jgi:hypothetical protein